MLNTRLIDQIQSVKESKPGGKTTIKYTKIDWCTLLMYLILGINTVKVIQPKAVNGY